MSKLQGCAKSKTMLFSFFLAVFGVLESDFGLLRELIGEHYYGLAFTSVAVIVASLRWATTSDLKDK